MTILRLYTEKSWKVVLVNSRGSSKFQSIMTKLVQGPYKLGYFYTKFLFLVTYPKAKMSNEKNWNMSQNQ